MEGGDQDLHWAPGIVPFGRWRVLETELRRFDEWS
jgi:hypothetical protein